MTNRVRNPLRLCSAPGDWALRGDPKYVEHLCTTPTGKAKLLPKVVAFTEAKDFNLGKALKDKGLHDWRSLQVTKDEARMGCAIAVHKDVVIKDWGQDLGASPFIRGRRVKLLPRYQTWLQCVYDGLWYFLDDVHDPPKRFSPLQSGYDQVTHATIAGHPNAVVMGDFNQNHQVVAKKLGLRVAGGSGIVGVLHRPGVKAYDVALMRWGIANHLTDHPATSVSLRS